MTEQRTRHDTISILLHGSLALVTAAVGGSSFFLDGSAGWLKTFHNSAGTIALILVVIWLVWRALQNELPQLATIGVNERRVMELTNGALNVLIVVVPILGILDVLGHKDTINLGAFRLSYPLILEEPILRWVSFAHNVLGKLLLVLAAIHSASAIWHHFVVKDGYLRRMLPSSSASE